jgi:hypothetical protein
MNELKIGQRVYYIDNIGVIPPGYYTIDSEERVDYGFNQEDEYYYFKELPDPDESRDGRARAWKERIRTLDELIVCTKCGGANILEPVWQNPNTKQIDSYKEPDASLHMYCKDCKNLVIPDTRESWEESRKPIVL